MKTQKTKVNWTVWYETRCWDFNGKKFLYRTKSLTDYHMLFHTSTRYRTIETLKMDRGVDWAFGLYSERIKKTINR